MVGGLKYDGATGKLRAWVRLTQELRIAKDHDVMSAAIVLERAPVYVLPDVRRTPLRTLETGTQIKVLEQQGDWDQIEFADSQWGPRIGWIQKRFVRLINR